MKLDLISNKKEKVDGINPNDEYYTPNYAILPLLKYLKPNSTIWCPFDTKDSNYVKLFEKSGFKVYHSHISEGADFFNTDPPLNVDYVISNPPYSLKNEVFNRLFILGIPFAMLVGGVGMFESQFRFKMFSSNKFEIMN